MRTRKVLSGRLVRGRTVLGGLVCLGVAMSATSFVIMWAVGVPGVKAAPRSGPAGPPMAPGQSVTMLPDGRWLFVGGEGADGRQARIEDPQTGRVLLM